MSFDTEHWHLEIKPKWVVQSKYKPTSTKCERCGGNGTVGGGFKDMDGPRECQWCSGIGSITHYAEIPEHPQIPEEFIEHMRNAYQTYFANKQKESNVDIQKTNSDSSNGGASTSTKVSFAPETDYNIYQYL